MRRSLRQEAFMKTALKSDRKAQKRGYCHPERLIKKESKKQLAIKNINHYYARPDSSRGKNRYLTK